MAHEIDLLHERGATVGVLNLDLQVGRRQPTVQPDLMDRVRSGKAIPLDPARAVLEPRSMVLTDRALSKILDSPPPMHVFPRRVLVLCDDTAGEPDWPARLGALRGRASEVFGADCELSARRFDRYQPLASLSDLLPVTHRAGPLASVLGGSPRASTREVAPDAPWRVGVLAGVDGERSFDTDSVTLGSGWEVWTYGPTREPENRITETVSVDESEMSLSRYLDKLDVLVHFPSHDPASVRYTSVWQALSRGIPVILPEWCRELFGAGPLYRDPSDLPEILCELKERSSYRRTVTDHMRYRALEGCSVSHEELAQRIVLLTGRDDTSARRPRPRRRRCNRILFFSSNGVGVGHLSRLLAVARRLPAGSDPIFLSLSQALPVVRQFGFHGEFLPFHTTTLSDFKDWNTWLRLQLDQLMAAYDIGTVVFDGSMPYEGLFRSVSTREDCRLVWLRRGMWRPDQDNSVHLSRRRHADLVIEPDDVANERDRGATRLHRDRVVVVDPIRLLDTEELLPRARACAALGLSRRKRYALIQLGAGNNFNTIDLVDELVGRLREVGRVQPVIAEWLTSEVSLDLWPDVPRLRCYPISRYYRAFDFTFSACGYNSFNEIISFGVPAVLVPNPNPTMDDQAARAAFADSEQAAIHLDSEARAMLPQVLAVMHEEENRHVLSRNCRRLARPNGAPSAAEIVARMAGISGDR
jgi:hypothetical protein